MKTVKYIDFDNFYPIEDFVSLCKYVEITDINKMITSAIKLLAFMLI